MPPPGGPGSCLVCCGPTVPSFPLCFPCAVVGRRLGAPLTDVLPAYLCPVPGPLYRVLVGYKEAPTLEARRHCASAVLETFDDTLADHGPCVAWALGRVPDLVVPVPSTRRPGPAALEQVEGLAVAVPRRLGGARWAPGALERAEGAVGHMRPNGGAYVVPPGTRHGVAGAAVVVLDDVYVSGARAQSAAAALWRAGAATVVVVVLGRVLRPGRVERHARFLARASRAGRAADTADTADAGGAVGAAGAGTAGHACAWRSPRRRWAQAGAATKG